MTSPQVPSLADRLEADADSWEAMSDDESDCFAKTASLERNGAAELRRLEGELSARHDAQDLTRSQRDSYQAENARLREALQERTALLVRIRDNCVGWGVELARAALAPAKGGEEETKR